MNHTERKAWMITRSSIARAAAIGLVLAAVGSCSEQAPLNRLGVNIVEKSVFSGSWYLNQTVVKVGYEGSGLGSFAGDAANDNADNSYGTVPRIRWVIDRDFLFAYRDYEVYEGLDGKPKTPGEQVLTAVAAYRIESHFDVRRDYNTSTTEESNVLVENATDRKWYERRFMRVDWSQNMLPAFVGTWAQAVDGLFLRWESVPYLVQKESDLPDSWAPRFDRMSCNGASDNTCKPNDREHADDYSQGELYHFSFVTQSTVSPASIPFVLPNVCLLGLGDCTAQSIAMRTSFLKVSPKRQYESANWSDSRWERAGYFRLERMTFDRQTEAGDPKLNYTDALNYGVHRHNIWKNWYTQDAQGRRTPVPYAQRQVRPVVWHTSSETPAHLIKPSFETVSQWNNIFMQTVRDLQGKPAPSYPDVSCQNTDPEAYCYCVTDRTSGRVLNESCPGKYNPFIPPSEYGAGVNPFDCHVQIGAHLDGTADPNSIAAFEQGLANPVSGPDGGGTPVWPENVRRLSDASFYPWFGAKMVGSECAQILRVNTCNRLTGKYDQATGRFDEATINTLDCQERGDSRFKLISYVNTPGTAFLGVATLRGDPTTGELRWGDANIGGPALDGYRTRNLEILDIMMKIRDERDIFLGEDVRDFFQSIATSQPPNVPRIDFTVANLKNQQSSPFFQQGQADVEHIMERGFARAQRLKGPEGRAQTMNHLAQNLAGTDIEARLFPPLTAHELSGQIDFRSGTQTPESVLEEVSPFRTSAHDRLAKLNATEAREGKVNYHRPNEYTDWSAFRFAELHKDWPRAKLEFELNRFLFRATQLHELGHCQGLRHAFGGSADGGNFHDPWYQINAAIPLPDPGTFDRDSVPGLNVAEEASFQTAYIDAKKRREELGVDFHSQASIMDYMPDFYDDPAPLGRYDASAIDLGYGDLVEVYDNSDNRSVDAITPVNTKRAKFKWYLGGEACTTDAECPYSASGASSSLLLGTNNAAGVTQKCIANPRATSARMCSNFDSDLAEMATNDRPRWVPVNYLFCSDDRVGSIAWCNRFDRGETYREIIANAEEAYDRSYIFSHFRRYRRTYDIGAAFGSFDRQAVIMTNVAQNLIYNYSTQPGATRRTGPLGFNDQFLATVDVVNFLAKVLTQPNVGQYNWNDFWKYYLRTDANFANPNAQVGIGLDRGRYFDTLYQGGLSGINRIERTGSLYEKYWAANLLTARGNGYFYTRDVDFSLSYYDLFPNEVQQIFSGMILDQPAEYMPRIVCPNPSQRGCAGGRLAYVDFYRGDCTTPGSTTCRTEPIQSSLREHGVLNGGTNLLLRNLATIYGLISFPVYFDTTFQHQLEICIEGNEACAEPRGVEGRDYMRYFSPRTSRYYLAWQLEAQAGRLDQKSLGFEMLREANDLQFYLDVLLRKQRSQPPTAEEEARLATLGYPSVAQANTTTVQDEIDRVFNRIQNTESFINVIMDYRKRLGIRLW